MQGMTTQATKLNKCNASDIDARKTITMIWGLLHFSISESAHIDPHDDDEHVTKKEM